MFCYKDMTWCEFNDCKFFDPSKCSRVMNEYHKETVKTNNIPVCLFLDKPECFEEK